ncbi:MAG: DUF2157 domain-containing protein [Alphaproteobacteria bacterium]|nr:DUF2157 domain-containing protein [Alphaproteobacteria bacterium]
MTDRESTYGPLAVFSKVYRKTGRWEREGLITDAQRDAILAFERASGSKRFVRTLFGLALFFIGLGMVSLIAANWVHIPGGIKLSAHFLLNLLAASVMFRAERENSPWWREGATAIFFALNLTFIVLTGQVFHLSGNTAAALSLWILISSPAVFLFGRSAAMALVWTVAALVTLGYGLEELTDHAGRFPEFITFLAAFLYTPLLLLGAGACELFRARSPAWAGTFYRSGMVLLIAGASLASLGWYDDLSGDMVRWVGEENYWRSWSITASICLSAPAAVLAYDRLRRARGFDPDHTGLWFGIGSLAFVIAPVLVSSPGYGLLSVVHFTAYWVFIAWVAARIRSDALMSWAVWLITLRLIIYYFEIFGGLLMNGIGFIVTGLLLLLVLRASAKIRARLSMNAQESAS